MKKIFLSVCLLVFTGFVNAQIKGILDRAKQKAENKAKEKANKKTDDPVDSTFSKTEKTGKSNPDEQNKSPEGNNQLKTNKDTTQPGTVSIKAYSKYDFVPGEKIIGYEDYMTGSIGDFPAGWNTNGAAEIVTIENKPGRWLMITKPGVFVPEFTNKLPDDFTFEFDLLRGCPFTGGNSVALFFSLAQLQNTDQPQNWGPVNNRFTLIFFPGNKGSVTGSSSTERRKNGTGEAAVSNETKQLGEQNNPVHISIWRQKERVRIYMNEEKVWDVPKALRWMLN